MIPLEVLEEERHQVVRDGFALGIEALLKMGKIDRSQAVSDLRELLQDGPSAKAEALLAGLTEQTGEAV